MPKISLVLPTYQEKDNILILLDRIASVLKKHDHEILVVDDSSPDQTGVLAQGYARAHQQVRVFTRSEKRGLSSAILEGFDQAQGDYLGVMDADLSHDETVLPALAAALEEGHGIAVASRRLRSGGVRDWPWYRRAASFGATCLTQGLLSLPCSDPLSGYFMIRREVYENVRGRLQSRGYKVLLEILARSQGARVKDIPYVFQGRERGVSKLSWSAIRDDWKVLMTARRERGRGRF